MKLFAQDDVVDVLQQLPGIQTHAHKWEQKERHEKVTSLANRLKTALQKPTAQASLALPPAFLADVELNDNC